MKTALTLLILALLTSASVAQWVEQYLPVTATLYSVSAVDNSTVWICGSNGVVLRTVNGGNNWQLTSAPNVNIDLYNIWGADASTAFVTGSSSTHTYVYKTISAGSSWTQVFSQAGGFINAISGLRLSNSADTLFICGNPVGGRWSLWRTDNAGLSWDSTWLGGMYIPQFGSETGFRNSLFIYRGSDLLRKIWFGTNNSRLYRWGFQFSVWDYVYTQGLIDSRSVLLVNETWGIAGGNSGILYTTNGGTNWTNWTSVPGTGSIDGFAVGYNMGELNYIRGSSIYQTTDAGASWINVHTINGTYFHMQKARASGDYNIWAVWNSSTSSTSSTSGISKFNSPIGVRPISSEVPNSNTLYQNYPNPFNPGSKIKFQTAKFGAVKLTVFDELGREVSILVNEQLKPGSYEVEWDASAYPSGVYFYKLLAGDYKVTRKMVLIK